MKIVIIVEATYDSRKFREHDFTVVDEKTEIFLSLTSLLEYTPL